MKRLRRRTFYRAVLCILLFVTFLFFLETYIQRIIPELTPLVEAELEELFNNKLDISIDTIEGGIFRHYRLKKVRLRDVQGAFPAVEIEQITLNSGLIGLLKNKAMGVQGIFYALSHPFIDLSIHGKEGWFNGDIRVEETGSGMLRFEGFKKPFKKENILFQGSISPSSDLTHTVFSVNASPLQGALTLEGEIAGGDLSISAKVDHMRLLGADIVSEALLTGSFKNIASGKLALFEGRLKTASLIINQRPFRDIDLHFQLTLPLNHTQTFLDRSMLDIKNLKLGKDIMVWGRVFLESPEYPIDITIVVDNLNITQLLLDLKVKMPELSYISGLASAHFSLKGPLSKLESSGRLDIKKGNLGQIIFETLSLSLKGNGPLLRITDSRINKSEGYMLMQGEMDLRNFNNDLFQDVWEGWNIVKENTGDLRIRATKPISDRMSIGFKTFVNDENDTQDDRRSSLELEYKLYKKDSLKMRMGAEQEYFGLEHTERF